MSPPPEKRLSNGGTSHDHKKDPPTHASNMAAATAVVRNDQDNTDASQGNNQQQPVSNPFIDQADAVLEALPGGATYLDGFSLLQVIANPRGNPEDLLSPSSSSAPTSFHGRYGSSTGGSGGSTVESTDLLTGTFQSLESTVVHVTEQMDLFNSVLEGWSRQILEEDPFAPSPSGEDIPDAQLKSLPPALQSLSLHDLQSYLEKSGLLAHAFRERQPVMQKKAAAEAAAEAPTPKVLASLRAAVPEVFWDMDRPIDLTDTNTFREVFLASDPVIAERETKPTASVFDFFPLVPEESLNPWLDQIELALLEAVREKSSDFFVESVRFGKLQQEIHALLTQVQQAQSDVGHVQDCMVNPSLNLPRLDQDRRDCQRLLLILDQVQDMIQAKASIPGYLSAADDLTALDQVQYGRKQLTEHDKGGENTLGRRRPLSNLTALLGVAKQLDQYQDLIVTNLREELVEVFMDWKPSSTGLPSNHGRVQDIVKALHNCQGWDATWQAYRNRLHDVLRLTLRTIVGEFSSSPTSSLTVQAFLECLDVTTEQFMALLQAAVSVKAYCVEHNVFVSRENQTKTAPDTTNQDGQESENENKEKETIDASIDEKASGVVISSAELAAKSVSELLRLRKEAHSLVSLDEMKQIWDKCSSFSVHLEELTGAKATAMRSALLSQAKAFAERQHEKHMSALAAALDSERWTQCQVSAERQEKISRLCTGRAILSRGFSNAGSSNGNAEDRKPDVHVGGVHYKVVWSCLLLVEMIMNDLSAAAHFTGLSTLMVTKVSELLRLFNARTTQLVLGAGAIHSAARLKSINAKHLSLVTQCLGMVIAIFPHVRAALMAHLPPKQHMLLTSIDTIKKEFGEHNEKVLNKFVTIIGGIVEHGLAPKLAGTDFDVRAEQIPMVEDGSVPSCVFFEGVSSNTKKMHHVLVGLLPPDHLQDVFSRIFAFIDQKVPTIIVEATKSHPSSSGASNRSPQRQMSGPRFMFPTTDSGKRRLLLEAEAMTKNLNGLEGVQPWDFSAVNVLENRLEYSLSGDHAITRNYEEDEARRGDEKDASDETEGDGMPGDISKKDEDAGARDETQLVKQEADEVENGEAEMTETNDTQVEKTTNETGDSSATEPGRQAEEAISAQDEDNHSQIAAETKEMDSEAETDVTTDTGDSEDAHAQPTSAPNSPTVAPQNQNGDSNPSESHMEEQETSTEEAPTSKDDIKEKKPSAENGNSPAHEQDAVPTPEYPAEVTSL